LVLRVFQKVKNVNKVHVEFVEVLFHVLLFLALLGWVLLDFVDEALFNKLLALVLCAFGECDLGLALLLGVKLIFVLLHNYFPRLEDHLEQVLQPLDEHSLNLSRFNLDCSCWKFGVFGCVLWNFPANLVSCSGKRLVFLWVEWRLN
jgi:hypothetical protein